MNITQYVSLDCRCPKCKGPCAIEGNITYKLPLGFGFGHNSKFQVDFIQYKGFYGFCMDCDTKVLFYKSRKIVTKTPKTINKKLKKVRN